MRVTMPTMGMGVGVVSAEHDDPNQVDDESSYRDKEKLLCVDVGRIKEPLHHFTEDKACYDNQEEAIDKATEDFHSTIAIGVEPCGLPATHQGCMETNQQSSAVKQHVKSIRYQAKAVCPNSISQLHKRKGLYTCMQAQKGTCT